jgi:hypothetical protein
MRTHKSSFPFDSLLCSGPWWLGGRSYDPKTRTWCSQAGQKMTTSTCSNLHYAAHGQRQSQRRVSSKLESRGHAARMHVEFEQRPRNPSQGQHMSK